MISGFVLLAGIMCRADQVQEPLIAGSPPSATKHTIARKVTLQGVPRFGEVTPTLYRGAQPTREGFSNLAKFGINIVVDLRGSRQDRASTCDQARDAVRRASLALFLAAG